MAHENWAVYTDCTPVADAVYGGRTDRSPTEVIADVVAEAADVDPVELPPLYDVVDTDAIDALFDRHHGGEDAKTLLRFTVEAWTVFVRSDGKIRVCDGNKSTEPKPVFETHTA